MALASWQLLQFFLLLFMGFVCWQWTLRRSLPIGNASYSSSPTPPGSAWRLPHPSLPSTRCSCQEG